MPANQSRDKILHRSFQVGIFFKGLDGLLETLGGLVFLCLSGSAITRLVLNLTRHELMEDPDDLIANALRHAFSHLASGAKVFVGAYLLGHGIIKVLIVAGLWRDKVWVFPIGLVVLVAFIGYQLFRLTSHFSTGLSLLTALDAVIVGLVWHEYRKRQRAAA